MSKAFETMYGTVHVVGNGHGRDVLWWSDLTDQEQEEFDYLSEDSKDWFSGFRYKGGIYDLADFEAAGGIFQGLGYDVSYVLSAFSAILVKYLKDDLVSVAYCHW